jgi:hypothetical protein
MRPDPIWLSWNQQTQGNWFLETNIRPVLKHFIKKKKMTIKLMFSAAVQNSKEILRFILKSSILIWELFLEVEIEM